MHRSVLYWSSTPQSRNPRCTSEFLSFRIRAPARQHERRLKADNQGGGGPAFQERERELKKELDALKEQAISIQQDLLQQAKQGFTKNNQEPTIDEAASLRARLESAIEAMSEGLIERDTEVRLLLLAALAGEHILYIGPPGTAKSELGRRLSRLAGGGVFFERLLTRFSVPEELFGPLSMKALEEDKYVRQTEGYLPSATVAFIDEVFKANSAILNTLLTLLNERLFDNGSVRMRVPLVCLVGASNELPESEELDALYDRFLVRKKVCQVSPGGLLEMLGNGGVRQTRALRYPGRVTTSSSSDDDETTMGSPLLTPQDFEEIKHKACDCVAVPASVLNLIADLRAFLQEKCEPPVYVSDRRLVKAVALLQVAAYTNGRLSLTEYDCLLLQHVLWQRPEECERIADWLLQKLASNDGLSQSEYLLSGMFGRACRSLDKPEAVKELLVEVAALKDLLVDRLGLTYGDVANGFSSVSQNVWLGRDEGAAIATALLPKLEKSRVHIESVLFEVVTLEVALENGAGPVELAQLLPEQWKAFLR